MYLNEFELQQALIDIIENAIDESELNAGDKYLIQSFEQAGILSKDHGIVLNLGKQQFQITIVRSK